MREGAKGVEACMSKTLMAEGTSVCWDAYSCILKITSSINLSIEAYSRNPKLKR